MEGEVDVRAEVEGEVVAAVAAEEGRSPHGLTHCSLHMAMVKGKRCGSLLSTSTHGRFFPLYNVLLSLTTRSRGVYLHRQKTCLPTLTASGMH